MESVITMKKSLKIGLGLALIVVALVAFKARGKSKSVKAPEKEKEKEFGNYVSPDQEKARLRKLDREGLL